MKATNAILVLGLGLAACAGPETPTSAVPPTIPARDVRTTAIVHTSHPGAVAVAGAVRARERAALSARVSASVTHLPYREGERVPAGAVVVRLDDAATRAALAAAEAGVQAAESDLQRTRRLLVAGDERWSLSA